LQFASPLLPATLLKRYKRFLTDAELSDGQLVTAHCPNTGSMLNCMELGGRIWLEHSNDPKRKLAYSWRFSEIEGSLISVYSALANQLVKEALAAGGIPELEGYATTKPEAKVGASRIDFKLSDPDRSDAFVEVKSVTLHQGDGLGQFPDAVTERGQKHIRELMTLAAEGKRAVLLFVAQHESIQRFSPADEIDPEYGRLLREAMKTGVEVLAYGCEFLRDCEVPQGIQLGKALPVLL